MADKRRRCVQALAAIVAGAVGGHAAIAQSPPIRETQSGAIAGTISNDIAVFRGVPYAAAPVGPLRWQPPIAPQPWRGTRAAAAFGAICPQPPAAGDSGVGIEPQSEDCLTLNIWQPAQPKNAPPLPVMVWFHGGGYVSGSGSAGLYDGAVLAGRGVVVVTFNYRLGRLGFLGPAALAVVTDVTDSQRAGMAVVILLLAVGAAILASVAAPPRSTEQPITA